ncbi:MAG: MTH1187 family thiamine-binding protein [bacterium]|jgi:uncharacterized protein (TIGR00106 family)
MAIAQVSITPLGTGSPSVSKYVANCHKVLEDLPDITWRLTPMATVLEGDLDLILQAVRRMHEVPFEEGVLRVSTLIKIDDRRDKKGTMNGKMDSVLTKLKPSRD